MKITVDTTHELEWERGDKFEGYTRMSAEVEGSLVKLNFGDADNSTGYLNHDELFALRALVNRAIRLVK